MPVHRFRIIGVVLYYVVHYKLCEVSATLRLFAAHRCLGDWLIDAYSIFEEGYTELSGQYILKHSVPEPLICIDG